MTPDGMACGSKKFERMYLGELFLVFYQYAIKKVTCNMCATKKFVLTCVSST
jgi:hypothetical protein